MKACIPATIVKDAHTNWCPGCGHGIVARCLSEAAEELEVQEDVILVIDVACGSLIESVCSFSHLGAAHGRTIIAASGVKRVRKDAVVIAHAGDGSAYAIGTESTIHVALRNENILALVVNNCVFGMTGGQMSPESIVGQKTTSTPFGRDAKAHGHPFDVIKTLQNFDIAYLARTSVDSPQEVIKTKNAIKKALRKQLNGEGFCLVEVLSPCPTNLGLTPIKTMEVIRNEVRAVFPTGEFIDRAAPGGENA